MKTKKRIINVPRGTLIILTLFILSNFMNNYSFAASFYYPPLSSKSNLLMDADSGIIYINDNIDQKLAIASITKVMNIYVALDTIKEKKISLDSKYKISSKAASIKVYAPESSGAYYQVGDEITLQELLEMSLIASDNGAAVELAEVISGSEENHIAKMNKKAKELGMKNTFFYNSSGLTVGDYMDEYIPKGAKKSDFNISTSRDLGIMAMDFIHDYPEVLNYSEKSSTKYAGQAYSTHNEMLKDNTYEYPGVKGLKTGTTDAAKECFLGYFTYENKNYISVVLGAPSGERFIDTAEMYDWIKEQSQQMLPFLPKNKELEIENIKGATQKNIKLYPKYSIDLLKTSNINIVLKEKKYNSKYFDKTGRLIKTIPKGEKVATFIYSIPKDSLVLQTVQNDNGIFTLDLVAQEDITTKGYFGIFLESINQFLSDFYNKI